MTRPEPSAKPRLAAGCRWSTQGEQRVVLYPEGMIRVQGSGLAILELCDGNRSVDEVVSTLATRFHSPPAKIQEDVGVFLETLQQKRIVDY